MNVWTFFLLQMAISLFISGVVVFVLSPALRPILADICGADHRARFWVTYSNVMMVLVPLLVVIFMGELQYSEERTLILLKRALGGTIAGLIVTLIIMSRQITRSIAPDQPNELPGLLPPTPAKTSENTNSGISS
ncbi:MAG: hypothetical protein HQL52_08050 [Magnetococcales bacterium]|nr:hypothetical protein [Magnetococcales bacterium]